jgi:peroxiredoxin
VKLALELEGESAGTMRKQPTSKSRIARGGLNAGTAAPSFTLADINGHTVSLEEFRGKQILLVFSDPHCGPCDLLASHLELIHIQSRQRNGSVVVIGRGDAEENRNKARQFGLSCPVLLQNKWEVSRQYAIFLTPVAYWIDEQGVVVRDVAKGVGEVLQLADAMLAASGKEANRVHAI